jgi:ribonuclease Y
MLVVVAAVIGALVGAAGSLAAGRTLLGRRSQRLQASAELLRADARREAEALGREAKIDAREELLRLRAELEAELHARRQRVADDERRIGAKEEELETRLLDLARKGSVIARRTSGSSRMSFAARA